MMKHNQPDFRHKIPLHSIPASRKSYQRGALLALVTTVAMSPAAEAAEPKFNAEVFFKPGNDRILGGAELVVPFLRTEASMPFLDLKGKMDDDDSWELNLGLGYRRLVKANDWLVGGWLGYDIREGEADETYDWISGGFEALSHKYDFRANFYYTDDDEEVVSQGAGFFSGSSLLRFSTVEEPLSGGDIEVGMLLPVEEMETRAYLAGYHFPADFSDDITGARLRLEVRPRKNIAIGLEAAYDEVREEQLFAELRYSFGHKNEKGIRTLKERMIDPVHRDIDGPTAATGEYRPYVNPDTGATPVIIHLDNSNDEPAEQQDGSLSHPYSSLVNYYEDEADRANTVVVVHQGDGTPTGYDLPLVLKNGQSVWGEGAPPFNIRGFGGPDRWPQMTAGEDEAVIRLANHNQVTGVTLRPVDAGVGIMGGDLEFLQTDPDLADLVEEPASGVTGFKLHRNTILSDDYDSVGVAIATLNGKNSTGSITGNRIDTGTPVILANGSANGSRSTQNVTVAGNNLTGHNYDFDGAVVLFNGDYGPGNTAVQTVNVSNNTINSAYYGVYIGNYATNSGSATQQVTVAGNTVLAEYDDAVAAWNMAGAEGDPEETSTATQRLTIRDNELDSDNYGIYLFNSTYAASATQEATITNNGINAYDDGIHIYNLGADAAAKQTVIATGNRIQSYYDGIYAVNNDESFDTQTLTFSDNIITADDYGIYVANWNSGTQKADISGNTISTDDEGVEIHNYGNGTQTVTVTDNTITSDDDGMDIENGASGEQTVTVAGNTIHGEDSGVEIEQWDGAEGANGTQTVEVKNNVIAGYEYGIYADSDQGTQKVTISDNTITSDEHGIYADHDSDTGTQTIDILRNTVSAFDAGIYVYNSSAGTQTVTIDDNVVDNADDEYAIYVANWSSGTQNADVTNNSVTTDDIGIYVKNDSTGTQEVGDISGNTVYSSNDYGIYVKNDSTGTQNVTNINDNTVQGYDHPIHVENEGGQQTVTNINRNNLMAQYDGIDLDNDNGTQTIENVQDNVINVYYYGIEVQNNSGTQTVNNLNGNTVVSMANGLHITNNTGDQTVENQGNEIDSSDNAVYIENHSGDQDVEIADDTIRSREDGIQIGQWYEGGTQNITVSGSRVSASDNGIEIDGAEGVQNIMVRNNTITGNVGFGVHVDNNGATQNVDLGGGDLESPGNNRIFNNLGGSVYAEGAVTVSAQQNWWGQAPPFSAQFESVQFVESGGASIDYSNALSADPGP